MAHRSVSRIAAPRRRALPALYGVFLEVDTLRRSIAEIRDELAASDADRLLATLDDIEGAALRLLDQVEQRSEAMAH